MFLALRWRRHGHKKAVTPRLEKKLAFVLAMVYGVIEGALFAVAAFVCSAFLLYDPIYSLRVSDVHALGELFWFLITALVGVKCVEELRRRSDKF